MRYLKGFLIFAFALAFLAALGWAAWRAILHLRAQYLLLSPEGGALFILIAALAVVCALYLGWTVRSALNLHGRASLAARASAYQDFIALWFPLAATGKPLSQWPDEWRRFEPRLALLAGDKVLKAYQQLQRKTDAAPPGDPEAEMAAERLVLEMRKDLGAKNRDWDMRAWRKLLG